MFDVSQDRPVYFDGHKPAGGKDWVMSHDNKGGHRKDIEGAIAYAKKLLAQRPGVPVKIHQIDGIGRVVATVSRDALGRTWVDSATFEPLI